MAVINIKMSEVEFVGQTKDQLGSAFRAERGRRRRHG